MNTHLRHSADGTLRTALGGLHPGCRSMGSLVHRAASRLGAAASLAVFLLGSVHSGHAEERNLRPVYDFVVETEGVADKGWRILASPNQRARLLLVSPSGDQYWLVSVSDKSARPVDRTLTKTNPDGSMDVLAGGVSGTRIIPLVMKGAIPSFTLDDRTISLKPRPPLIGEHTVNDLVNDRPPFGEGIKKYQPEETAVSYLKSYDKPTEIEVFFGSWCSVCEAWVPKFLKSLEIAGNSRIKYKLIGLSRDFQNDKDLGRQKGVRGLPTFIIRQNGIEVGRIVGAPPKGTVEEAVAEVLRTRS